MKKTKTKQTGRGDLAPTKGTRQARTAEHPMENATEEIEFVMIRGVLFSKKTEVSYYTEDGLDELKIVIYKMINNRVVEKKIRLFNSFEIEEEEKEWFEVPQDIVDDVFEEELKIQSKSLKV